MNPRANRERLTACNLETKRTILARRLGMIRRDYTWWVGHLTIDRMAGVGYRLAFRRQSGMERYVGPRLRKREMCLYLDGMIEAADILVEEFAQEGREAAEALQ